MKKKDGRKGYKSSRMDPSHHQRRGGKTPPVPPPTTLADKAALAYRMLTRIPLDLPTEHYRVTIKNGAPSWVTDLCRHAHGTMLPDDHKFMFIEEALSRLEDLQPNDDPQEIEMPEEVYNARLAHWLATNLERFGYCDEAVVEYGGGLGGDDPTFTLLSLGYGAEQREVLELCVQFLNDLDLTDDGMAEKGAA